MSEIIAPYLIYLGDTPIPELAKTGAGLAYWRPERCIGQLREPGCKADVGLPDMSIAEAAQRGARTLVIGTAAPGGRLPDNWIARFVEAMEQGLDIASGLHVPLAAAPQLAEAAQRTGRILHDVRLAKQAFPVASGKPRSGHRLLTMGTDCAIGKKYTALAIHRELVKRGVAADFRATGQTGVLIDGRGFAVDAIVSDFVAGAAEVLSPAAHPDHWDIIEGQGSLVQPAYAGVTLALLHGSQPDAFVVCHEHGRRELSLFPGFPTAGISELINLTIALGRVVSPNIRCVGLSINTASLDDRAARAELEFLARIHRVPAVDPVRYGAGAIADYMLASP
jgi:uncharacterized NAD-dependent epimerase/dehydratase family protein